MAPMTTCRSSPCVLTCRALYVIGGVSYVGMSLNTGEYLDPATGTWKSIAPMHDKRASASGAATNGKIYVIGKPLIQWCDLWFYLLSQGGLNFAFVDKILKCDHMEATVQYFPLLLFIMLYKAVLTFESVDENP